MRNPDSENKYNPSFIPVYCTGATNNMPLYAYKTTATGMWATYEAKIWRNRRLYGQDQLPIWMTLHSSHVWTFITFNILLLWSINIICFKIREDDFTSQFTFTQSTQCALKLWTIVTLNINIHLKISKFDLYSRITFHVWHNYAPWS